MLSTGYPVTKTAISRPNAINNIGAIFKIIFGRFMERPVSGFPNLYFAYKNMYLYQPVGTRNV